MLKSVWCVDLDKHTINKRDVPDSMDMGRTTFISSGRVQFLDTRKEALERLATELECLELEISNKLKETYGEIDNES